MASYTGYKDFIEGTLQAAVAAGTTTGVKVTVRTVNGASPTWLTGAHRLMFVRKTLTSTEVEKVDVASGTTQSGSTVTLGTLTRGLSLTDGTTFASGTGRAFPAGTKVYLAWDTHDAEQTVKKDAANTLTGSGAIRSSSTTTPAVRLNNVTTTQRDAMSASNGDLVYNTTTGEVNQYVGGAWAAVGDTGTSDASPTAAGKVEIATTAEIRAETATGGSGAPVVISADATAVLKDDRIVLKDATELTIVSGAITVTQPYHNVDTESDAASDDLDTINAAVGVGEVIVLVANNTARTVVIKHNTGNIKTADGLDFSLDDTEKSITLLKQTSNWIEIARGAGSAVTRDYVKCVYNSGTSSAALTNPTSLTAFDTHTFSIPTGTFIAGTSYRVRGIIGVTWAAGEVELSVMLGSTAYATPTVATVASGQIVFEAELFGTTSAGAAAAIRTGMTAHYGTGDGTDTDTGMDYASVNAATNGALTLQVGFKFLTSNAGNAATLLACSIDRVSSTIFTS